MAYCSRCAELERENERLRKLIVELAVPLEVLRGVRDVRVAGQSVISAGLMKDIIRATDLTRAELADVKVVKRGDGQDAD